MTTPLQPPTRGLLGASLRFIATAALLALLTQGAAAQDNDDDGVLPVSGGSSENGDETPDAGSGSGNQSVSIESDVLVAGELQDAVDPTLATIEFEPAEDTDTAGLVTGASIEEATFVAEPAGFSASETGQGQALQGSGTLRLHEGLQTRFVPAQVAAQSVAVLVITADGDSLEAEVSGATQPELVVPLGGATAVDLARFAQITAKFGALLPGYHATIVFVSVQAGELHTAAVRAYTAGGALEVIIR